MKNKLYVVQKYVIAASIKSAMKIEKEQEPDDVFMDADWKKINFEPK